MSIIHESLQQLSIGILSRSYEPLPTVLAEQNRAADAQAPVRPRMNVLYVTNDDAELTQELRRIDHDVHVDATPDVRDALARLQVPERCQIVLIDGTLRDNDA